MFNLAVIYDNGFGIAADKTRALHYYKAASDLSNIYAQYNLDGNILMVKVYTKTLVKRLVYMNQRQDMVILKRLLI